ncbi:MAG: hypothetical protein HY760_05325, partial [Nitrospirae bacterium]|nr:hypothetical protein [Nitrospirota bacterium]
MTMDSALLPRKEDRDQYLRRLKSTDSAQRREAAERLAEIGREGAVYPL